MLFCECCASYCVVNPVMFCFLCNVPGCYLKAISQWALYFPNNRFIGEQSRCYWHPNYPFTDTQAQAHCMKTAWQYLLQWHSLISPCGSTTTIDLKLGYLLSQGRQDAYTGYKQQGEALNSKLFNRFEDTHWRSSSSKTEWVWRKNALRWLNRTGQVIY